MCTEGTVLVASRTYTEGPSLIRIYGRREEDVRGRGGRNILSSYIFILLLLSSFYGNFNIDNRRSILNKPVI